MSPLLTTEQKENINLSLKKQLTFFIPNMGQLASPAQFLAKGPNYILYFTPTAVNMVFRNDLSGKNSLIHHSRRFNPVEKRQTDETEIGLALSFRFVNSNPSVSIEGRKRKSGIINFFNGNDPTKWQNNLHSYEEIVYHELWPYIDMIFRNADGILKYKYILRPGANLNDIRLLYDGADDLSIDKERNLLVHTPLGTLTDQRPISYQQNAEHQIPITTEFVLERLPDGSSCFGFTVSEDYDAHYPLVIDPGLIYSTFVSGGADSGYGIALDTSGNVYVTGFSVSTSTIPTTFPTTPGAFQVTYVGGSYDAFVFKLNPAGSALIYSTYLGGSSDDMAADIAIDKDGNAYILGYTQSDNFPTTAGSFQTTRKGSYDAFITKLNPTGSALVYSTYLGGSGFELAWGIAIDADNNAYVTGWTQSTNFPTTAGALQTTYGGGLYDAFISKLTPPVPP